MNRESNLQQLHTLSDMLHQMQEVLGRSDLRHNRPKVHSDDSTDVELIKIQWSEISSTINRLRSSINEQEEDIKRMEPWGEIDFNHDEQLRQIGLSVGYWTLPIAYRHYLNPFEGNDRYQVRVIHTDDRRVYFTTTTATGMQLALPHEAAKARIVPSPVSTLIMLQTRQKDHLKRELLLQNDFAYAHYQEVEQRIMQLHKEPGIPMKYERRNRIMRRMNIMLRKISNRIHSKTAPRKK